MKMGDGREMASFQHVLTACLIFLGASAASIGLPAAVIGDSGLATGATQEETVFFIPSSGLIADSTFIAASLSGGGSAMSEQLALLILQARDRATQITVTGANETKTLRVIRDSFESVGLVDLSLLDFTFIGSPKAAAHVEKIVKAVHGTFHTRLNLHS
jgi:hypothetical protein